MVALYVTEPPGLRLTVLQLLPVIVHAPAGVLTQVQLSEPESNACDTLLKVSVRLRLEVVPPPTFSTVPLIG